MYVELRIEGGALLVSQGLPRPIHGKAQERHAPLVHVAGSPPGLERGTILERELQQAVAAGQVQFGADIGAMRLHGPSADEEFCRNLPTRLFLRNKFQDAQLGFGQVMEPGLLCCELL